LLIIVAESTDIFLPISQFGCAHAWSGVTRFKSSIGVFKNGPPEAVNNSLRIPLEGTLGAEDLYLSCIHWKIALCSLSIDKIAALFFLTDCMKIAPTATKASLFANKTLFPASTAAKVAGNPAAPTMAAITVVTSGSATVSHKDCAPTLTS